MKRERENEKLPPRGQETEPLRAKTYSKAPPEGKDLPLRGREKVENHNKGMKELEKEKEKKEKEEITYGPPGATRCPGGAIKVSPLIVSKEKLSKILRTTHMRLGGGGNQATVKPPRLILGACLQRPGINSYTFSRECWNLILDKKDVPRGSSSKRTGLSDLYPCLKAEFGDNKFQGESLDALHTELGSAPVSRNLEAGCYLEARGCSENGCCLEAGGCSENGCCLDDETCSASQINLSTTIKNIIIIDINSKAKAIQLKTTNQLVTSLIDQISEITRIPLSDLRCIYQNKELLLQASRPIEELGIQDGDFIYVKLRLKGGSNQAPDGINGKGYAMYSQEEKDALFQGIRQQLSLTKEYYLGDEIPEESRVKAMNYEQATGEIIDQTLRNILHDEVHIIHPDTLYLTSIFSNNKTNADYAITTLVKQIYDMKKLHVETEDESYEQNPPLDKPIIAILNTQGRNDSTEDKENSMLKNCYGSHWMTLVILPRHFIGLKYKFSANNNPQYLNIQEREQIYLYDSLPHFPTREIPFDLKKALKQGLRISTQTAEGVKLEDCIPSTVGADCLMRNNTYKRQQAYGDNTCGYWAIYNALMTVLDGTDNFWHDLFRKDSSEDETKFGAGCYLRSIIKEFSQGQFLTTIPLLQQGKDNDLLNETAHFKQPECTEQLSSEELISEDYKNKRKFATISQTKLDHMIVNPQKTPEPSPKKTPKKKRTKTNSYKKAAQEKILISLNKFEQEQTALHSKINEMQEYIAELNKEIEEKDGCISSMRYENHMLRESMESQRITLQENYADTLREHEKAERDQLRIQELEEIIHHQNEQAQIRLKQLQSLQEENSHLHSIINKQEFDSARITDSMLSGISRLRDKQAPKLDELDKIVSAKENKGKSTNSRKSSEDPLNRQHGTMEPKNKPEAMEIEKRQSDSPVEKKCSESPTESKKKVSMPGKKEKSLLIPWKGKILTPTPPQLRQYAGNLNEIAKNVGSREPEGKEAQYRGIRIKWRNRTLTASPRHLLTSGGDLNKLTSILDTPIRRRSNGTAVNSQETGPKRYFLKGSKDYSQERGRSTGNTQFKQGYGAWNYPRSSNSPY